MSRACSRLRPRSRSSAGSRGCVSCGSLHTDPVAVLGAMLVVAFVAAGVLLRVRIGFAIDARLGAGQCAQLAFVRMPTTYRS